MRCFFPSLPDSTPLLFLVNVVFVFVTADTFPLFFCILAYFRSFLFPRFPLLPFISSYIFAFSNTIFIARSSLLRLSLFWIWLFFYLSSFSLPISSSSSSSSLALEPLRSLSLFLISSASPCFLEKRDRATVKTKPYSPCSPYFLNPYISHLPRILRDLQSFVLENFCDS